MKQAIRDAIQAAKQRAKRDAMRNGTRQMILDNMGKEFNIAVNITTDLSKLYKWDNTLGRVLIKQTKEEIDNAMHREINYLQNTLNNFVYGNNWRRKNKRVKIVTVREWNKGNIKQPHFHLAVAIPKSLNLKETIYKLINIWSNTQYGGKEFAVEPIHDKFGWAEYLTKNVKIIKSDTTSTDGLYLEQTYF